MVQFKSNENPESKIMEIISKNPGLKIVSQMEEGFTERFECQDGEVVYSRPTTTTHNAGWTTSPEIKPTVSPCHLAPNRVIQVL